MLHLPVERLAALMDDPPTSVESAHLASCEECRREEIAYQELASLTKSDPDLGPLLTQWESLAPVLRAEGLIGGQRRAGGSLTIRTRGWLQVAAALVLAAGGVAAGRYSAGATLFPSRTAESARVADTTTGPAVQGAFQSIADAQQAQRQSQAEYQAAMAFLAERDTAGRAVDSPASIKARLAALDQVSATMDRALQTAPYDPVINGYYLSTIGDRAATLRQLNTASIRLTPF